MSDGYVSTLHLAGAARPLAASRAALLATLLSDSGSRDARFSVPERMAGHVVSVRGGKGRQWEGGIREPLYVLFPGVVEPGTVCSVPMSGIDFYPTLLELAGLEHPAEQAVDRRSMVPAAARPARPRDLGPRLLARRDGGEVPGPRSAVRRGLGAGVSVPFRA